eukprot:2317086-Rhodomonas_salina.1
MCVWGRFSIVRGRLEGEILALAGTGFGLCMGANMLIPDGPANQSLKVLHSCPNDSATPKQLMLRSLSFRVCATGVGPQRELVLERD